MNRQTPDLELFAQVRFVAYELIQPLMTPENAYAALAAEGFEVAESCLIPKRQMTVEHLSQLFTSMEAASSYQLDGIVIAPNVADRNEKTKRTQKTVKTVKAVNPADRMAWKIRVETNTARTIVRDVEWNVSPGGYLIPRVLFDAVQLSGSLNSAATGINAKWILDNKVGVGAEIEIKRANDTIPKIERVITPVEPLFPPPTTFAWTSCGYHIVPVEGGDPTVAVALVCARLTKALGELGAENVGPGIVAKLYAAGFTDIRKIYAASVADIARADGFQTRGAERIHAGLRVKQDSWTELNFMIASCTMPRGVGHTKLAPLLEVNPDPASWILPLTTFPPLAGISAETVAEIQSIIPDYLRWRAESGLMLSLQLLCQKDKATEVKVKVKATGLSFVFTGVRDAELESALESRGHQITNTVTKKTTHVIHADDAAAGSVSSESVKIKKAREQGSTILSLSECRNKFIIENS
jgi:DNA ligase (NAD+)